MRPSAWVLLNTVVLGAFSRTPAAATESAYDAPSGTEVVMRYRNDGGHSPYRLVEITLGSTGKAVISLARVGEKAPAVYEYDVEPHEWKYFLGLFRLESFFDQEPDQRIRALDAGRTTLYLKVGEKSREIEYNWGSDRIRGAFGQIWTKTEVLLRARKKSSEGISRGENLGFRYYVRWDLPLSRQREQAAAILNDVLSSTVSPLDLLGVYVEDTLVGDARTVEILLKHLENCYAPDYVPDNATRYFIDSLGHLGDRRAIPFLMRIVDESECYRNRAVLALARLGCDAVLPETVQARQLEALGLIGRGHREPQRVLEKEAFALGSSRHRRWLAYNALGRMGALRPGANMRALGHVLLVSLCMVGLGLVAAPAWLGKTVVRAGSLWPRLVGAALVVLGGLMLFSLHVTFFY